MEEVNKFIKKKFEEYAGKGDWRVKENSNSYYSFSGLQAHLAGTMTAMYALNEMYPKEIADAHRLCDLHVHDLSHANVGYCCGWSLPKLIKEGFGGVTGKVNAKPAKHYDAILGQMMNFIGTLQNEWAGAQAFNSFDTLLAPFVKQDNLSYKEVKQGIQEFIYGLNQNSRWSMQAPFSNITLDIKPAEDLKNKQAVVGGIKQPFKYGDCQAEMDMINLAFVDVMTDGDANGRPFTFPIPTYNLTKELEWESPVFKEIFRMTAKFGYPYFQNLINSDLDATDIRSMCCRLQLDLTEVKKKTGGLFGYNDSTGSIGVVTINMPKIGYLTKTKETFFKRLERFMDLAKDSLEIKRKVISKSLDSGLLPYTSIYLGHFNSHFSTIGLNGMHECCLNFLQKGIETPEGKAFTIEVLDFMNKKIIEYQEKTTNLYNLEATPAEGTSHRFATHDQRHYKDIITAGINEHRYYTNCVSEDTECLTIDGWKKYDEIDTYSKILTLNTNTKELEYQSIQFLNKQEVTDTLMYNIKTQKQDQLITPQHRVLYDGKRDGTYRFSTPQNIPYRAIIPTAGNYDGTGKPSASFTTSKSIEYIENCSDDIIRLIGWIITEGHFLKNRNGIRITQAEWCNKEKFDEIEELLKRLKLKYSIYGDKRGRSTFGISSEDSTKIKRYIDKKNIPRWCLNCLSQKQMNILLETMMKGDGSISKHSCYYSTGDKQLADEFQELCMKCNKRAMICDYKEKNGAYHIVPCKISHVEIKKKDLYEKKYTGIVWCPTVENGTWIARRNGKAFITGNSTNLPVDHTEDIFEALEHQEEIQTRYSSGTVFHIFLGEKLPHWKSCMNLVKKVAESSKIPYFSITPTFSICEKHGYIPGEHFKCPYDEELEKRMTTRCKTEVYSRVVGYFRPVEQWNDGKAQEFKERKEYKAGE